MHFDIGRIISDAGKVVTDIGDAVSSVLDAGNTSREDPNMGLCDYSEINEYFSAISRPTVVFMRIKGPIMDDINDLPPSARRLVTSGPDFREAILQICRHKCVRLISVKLDTPGGTITGSYDIHYGMLGVKGAKKPLLSYIKRGSFSGGVISMVPSSVILIHPDAHTGSIGVIGGTKTYMQDVTRIDNGLFGGQSFTAKKFSFERYAAGQGKDYWSYVTPPDEHVKKILQDEIDRMWEIFVLNVCRNRDINIDALDTMNVDPVKRAAVKEVRMRALQRDPRKAVEAGLAQMGVDPSTNKEAVELALAKLQLDPAATASDLPPLSPETQAVMNEFCIDPNGDFAAQRAAIKTIGARSINAFDAVRLNLADGIALEHQFYKCIRDNFATWLGKPKLTLDSINKVKVIPERPSRMFRLMQRAQAVRNETDVSELRDAHMAIARTLASRPCLMDDTWFRETGTGQFVLS